MFAQLEAVVKNAVDTLSCHSKLVFIITYINCFHNLITKWGSLASLSTKWGGFSPPQPPLLLCLCLKAWYVFSVVSQMIAFVCCITSCRCSVMILVSASSALQMASFYFLTKAGFSLSMTKGFTLILSLFSILFFWTARVRESKWLLALSSLSVFSRKTSLNLIICCSIKLEGDPLCLVVGTRFGFLSPIFCVSSWRASNSPFESSWLVVLLPVSGITPLVDCCCPVSEPLPLLVGLVNSCWSSPKISADWLSAVGLYLCIICEIIWLMELPGWSGWLLLSRLVVLTLACTLQSVAKVWSRVCDSDVMLPLIMRV